MTNSQNSDNQGPPPDNRRRWLPIVRRAGVAIGVTLVVGGAGALAWLWYFVNNNLAPLVQRELTKTLNRPVELGPVKSFSLTGIRFGPSSLPATATDPDRAITEAVKVAFDLPQLLATRTLNLQIVFVNANAYIEQDEKGQWVTVPKFTRQEPGFVKIELDFLAFENTNVTLVPYERANAQIGEPRSRGAGEPGSGGAREQGSKGAGEPGTGDKEKGTEPTIPNPQSPIPNPQSPIPNPQSPVPSPQSPIPNSQSPNPQIPPIELQSVNGALKFRDKYQQLLYEVRGQSTEGGTFNINGSSKIPNIRTSNITVKAQDFPALALNRLLKRTVTLPIDLSAGKVDGNLELQFLPDKFPEIVGGATLKAVTARLNPLPKLLTQTNGRLTFQPAQKIQVNNVTTIYGKVPAFANGLVALKDDSNLAIEVKQVKAKYGLESLDVAIPFTLEGEVQASLQVRGPATKPVITGIVSSLETADKKPFVVDRVPLTNLGAGFTLAEGNLKLQYFRAVPTVGGQITGEGNIQLGTPDKLPLLSVLFRATELPGDAIAPLYNINSPIALGLIAATGELVGPSNNLQTTVRWDAPNAAYPASGTAIAKGALETVIFRDTVAKIAGGTAFISGELVDKQWQATIQPENLQLGKLAEIANTELLKNSNFQFQNTNLPGQVLTGSILLSGNTLAVTPENVNVNGLVVVNAAGGTANISGQLSGGRWQTSIDPSGLELGRLAALGQTVLPNLSLPLSPSEISNLPLDLNNAYITLSGTTENLTTEAINANANARLNVAGGTADITGRLEAGNWQATVKGSDVALDKLVPRLPKSISGAASLPLPPSVLGPVSGEITLAGTTADLSPEALRAGDGQVNVSLAGGTVTVEDIRLAEGRWRAIARVSQIQLSPLVTAFAPNVQTRNFASQLGPFTGAFALSGLSDRLDAESISVSGSGSLGVAGGSATVTDLRTRNGRWEAAIDVAEVAVAPLISSNLPPTAPPLPISALGRFAGRFDVSGQTNSFAPNTIQLNGSGGLSVAGGSATLSAKLNKGQWQALVAAEEIPVNPFLPASIGSIATQDFASELGRFTGRFEVAGNTDAVGLDAVRFNGSGGLSVAGGSANFTGTLADGQWQATVAAAEIPAAPFLPAQAGAIASELGRLTGNLDLSGTTEGFELASIRATGSGTLGVAGGTVTASDILVAAGEWQSAIAAEQVQLGRLSEQLRGLFNGNLNVSGSLEGTHGGVPLQAIRARGDVFLSEGVAIVKQPLNATIGWDGEKLQIQQATAPGLNANGFIYVDTRDLTSVQLSGVDLNVRATRYNLQDLPLEQLPSAIALSGATDFTGRISGTPDRPRVIGDVQLYDLRLNQVAFDPILAGNVALVTGERIQVDLKGKQDAIQLDAIFPSSSAAISFPNSLSFLLRRGEAIARGTGSDRGLQVEVEQFPIATFNLTAPTAVAPGPISGDVSGKFNVVYGNLFQCQDIECALNAVQVGGNVAIAQPRIGQLKADKFEGQIAYDRGVASLINGELLKGNSQYLANARIALGADPQFQANLKIARGEVQDILASLQIFRFEDIPRRLQNLAAGLQPPDYAAGAEVAPLPITVANRDILTQLRRFSEIVALLEQQQQARKDAFPFPELRELQATFGGEIAVAGSLRTGINSQFQISGENWKWGDDYVVDKAIVNGSFENNVLTLLPASFQTGETLVAFSGTVGGESQSGQLRVENFSVEDLQAFVEKFIDVPLISVTGKLNARATIAGSLLNPQARGEITLVEGTLNRTPVQSALSSFSYSNSRLNFGSTVLVSGSEPLQIIGSIPYQILPQSVPPDNDRISLAVNVQNEGLALLNLISGGEVEWVSGKGQVQLQVEGTLDDPVATGIAEIENATIQARLLPEPLKEVMGRVRFNSDRVLVEGITGQFSKGQVVVLGVLPIARPLSPNDPDTQNILRVSLDKLALNLKGLYRGGVNGLVEVTGTALQPQIGGEVQLTNGQVLLSDAVATGGANRLLSGASATGSGRIEPSLNALKLVLGQNVQITRPPVLNFVAAGDLTINGPLDNLQPQGTIRLRRGQVNLFTTQFRLIGGYEQKATFTPEGGLDPYLDVRLGAIVSEVTGSRQPSSAFSNEIADDPAFGLGSTQTVRIQAQVEGPASEVFDNLELTSSPSRSESEIVALLGGGFVNTLGRGDSTLAIANLAGSALLTPLESVLTNALGLSEFRLFPTIITRDGKTTSTLGLAAEAGIDITRKLSFSVLRVLTDSLPTQYNLRYRLNDRTLLRGTTDLSGESRGTVEYEIRF